MKQFGMLFATFLATLFISPLAFAVQKSGDVITLPSTETINEDYFASGNQVTLSGTVNGDAFLAGGNISVDGTVNGDLLVAGGNIDVGGNVTGNIRAVGGQVNVSGVVGRNLSVAAGSVNLAQNAQVRGNLSAGAGSINASAPIEGSVTAGAGQLTLGNSVGGNVEAAANVSLTPSANIAGNLTYWSTTQANISPGARVSGQITQNQPPQATEARPEAILGFLAVFQLWMAAALFIAYLTVGLFLLRFAPAFTKGVAGQINQRPWASLGIGFLALILAPLLIFILFVTLLGIPLALFLLSLFVIVILLSKVFIALSLGRKIFDTFNFKAGDGWAFFIGLIVYIILTLIPFVGGIVILAAASLGVGALILSGRKFLAKT